MLVILPSKVLSSFLAGGRTRSVPFPAMLTPIIEQLISGKQPDDQLVTSPAGGLLRLGNWRHRVFDPAARAIGRVDIHPHDLRDTAASRRSRPERT